MTPPVNAKERARILDALDLSPLDFPGSRAIEAAMVVQQQFWERRSEWRAYEDAVVTVLWALVADAEKEAE